MWGLLIVPAAIILSAVLNQTPPPSASDTVILLPDEDGSVGELTVAGDGGQQTLDTAYATVSSGTSGELAVGTTSAAAVEAEFGELLNATPIAPRSFTVNFESGSSSELTAASRQQVEEIKTYLLTLPAPEILVVGHTDRVGSQADNDRLSRQRAEAVKRTIQAAGVRTVRIQASGRGEREPVVQTADGVAEPRNRRVEIRVR